MHKIGCLHHDPTVHRKKRVSRELKSVLITFPHTYSLATTSAMEFTMGMQKQNPDIYSNSGMLQKIWQMVQQEVVGTEQLGESSQESDSDTDDDE